jgi:hypothetical protein
MPYLHHGRGQSESFGSTLDEWRTEASPGKDKRFGFLLSTPGLVAIPSGDNRYRFSTVLLLQSLPANSIEQLQSFSSFIRFVNSARFRRL